MSMKQKVIARSEELRVDVFLTRDERNGSRVELYAPSGWIFQATDAHCAISGCWYAEASWAAALDDLEMGLTGCLVDNCEDCVDNFTDHDIQDAVYYAPRMWA